MKKQIISIVVALFALAVQAGSEKAGTSKESSCCCSDTQSTKAAQSQAVTAKASKGTCTANQTSSTRSNDKQVLRSPKALASAR